MLTLFLLYKALPFNRTQPTPPTEAADQSTMFLPVHEPQLQCQRASPETGTKKYKDLLCGSINDKIYFYHQHVMLIYHKREVVSE